jgi:hypothetical protein
MDGLPFGMPGSLPDFLGQQAALYRQRRGRAQGAKRTPPRPAAPAEGGRVPLVDGLTFRIVTTHTVPTSKGSGFAGQAAAIAEAFRGAFLGVWGRLPGQDRERLRAYWRGDLDRLPGSGPFAPRPASPRIRIVAQVPWSPADFLTDKLGTELNFPADLVTEHPDELPHAVARALAEAHLHATRRHWGLALELIEEPLARWERRMGRRANDVNRDARIDQLEAAHRLAYAKEIGAILARWRFAPQVPAAGP